MAMIDRELLRDRFRGCMIGLAVGDALGMPVETMTREEILAATGGVGVTGYLAPLQQRFRSTARLAPGQWTDDTQLSLAIARSLVRKRGFDLDDIAAEHVVEYHKGRRGWGRSTKIGIQELAEGKRKPGEPVLDPEALGLGNGVAMKIAPLALAEAQLIVPGGFGENAKRVERLVYRFPGLVRSLAELTHRDACASIGAFIVSRAIQVALLRLSDRLSPMLRAMWSFELGYHCKTHGESLLQSCARIAAHFVDREHGANRLMGALLPASEEDAQRALRPVYGDALHDALSHHACDVRESVPFVYATAMEHWISFRDGVLAAVNAGGDTDSNAAMIGAILGAYHGLSAIPREWVDGLEAHDEITAIADQLFDLAMSR
ncbi:MAG: ADP-ribosylglycohydrolase family protein [Candidatus Uhrbacteria bacterium]